MASARRSTGGAPFLRGQELMPPETDPNTLVMLGEIRGQLRELIHTGNNTAQAVQALGDRVGKLERMDGRVNQLELLAPRLAALESDRHRRDGASGVVAAILKSPAIGWMVGGATFLWGILTGRIHL
jgi:hypothetical protein